MFTSWSSQLATTNSGKDRRTLLPSNFIALPHISNHLLTVTQSKYSGWLLVLIGAMHWVRPTFVAMLSKWGFQWASHPEAISCEDKKFRARESKSLLLRIRQLIFWSKSRMKLENQKLSWCCFHRWDENFVCWPDFLSCSHRESNCCKRMRY